MDLSTNKKLILSDNFKDLNNKLNKEKTIEDNKMDLFHIDDTENSPSKKILLDISGIDSKREFRLKMADNILNQNRSCFKVAKTRSTIYNEFCKAISKQGLKIDLNSITIEKLGYTDLGLIDKHFASKYLNEIKQAVITGNLNNIHANYRNSLSKEIHNLHMKLIGEKRNIAEEIKTKNEGFYDMQGKTIAFNRNSHTASTTSSIFEIARVQLNKNETSIGLVANSSQVRVRGKYLIEGAKQLFGLKNNYQLLEYFDIFVNLKTITRPYLGQEMLPHCLHTLEVCIIPKENHKDTTMTKCEMLGHKTEEVLQISSIEQLDILEKINLKKTTSEVKEEDYNELLGIKQVKSDNRPFFVYF